MKLSHSTLILALALSFTLSACGVKRNLKLSPEEQAVVQAEERAQAVSDARKKEKQELKGEKN